MRRANLIQQFTRTTPLRTMIIAVAAGILAVTMFLFLSGGTAHAAQHDPSGKTYEVTVRLNVGIKWQDCFRFGVDGSFTGDLLGAGEWVTRSDDGTTLHFALDAGNLEILGVTTDFRPGWIRARADTVFEDEYEFRGFENPACSVTAQGTGEYQS